MAFGRHAVGEHLHAIGAEIRPFILLAVADQRGQVRVELARAAMRHAALDMLDKLATIRERRIGFKAVPEQIRLDIADDAERQHIVGDALHALDDLVRVWRRDFRHHQLARRLAQDPGRVAGRVAFDDAGIGIRGRLVDSCGGKRLRIGPHAMPADVEQHYRIVRRDRIERRRRDWRSCQRSGLPLTAGQPFAGFQPSRATPHDLQKLRPIGSLRNDARPVLAVRLQERVDVHVVQAGKDRAAGQVDDLRLRTRHFANLPVAARRDDLSVANRDRGRRALCGGDMSVDIDCRRRRRGCVPLRRDD